MPLWAKSWIVILGNQEECDWSKSERFAPVLRFNSLRFLVSLAVQHRHGLKQGDCKNAFCHGDLPPDEVTIVRPPSGDPDSPKDKYWLLAKMLHGLCRSPCHWYQKIDAILHSIGLVPSPHDPCFYTSFIKDPQYLSNTCNSTSPLSLGLYVNNFAYFSKDPKVEQLFKHLLHQWING
jgi:hypothetical protein